LNLLLETVRQLLGAPIARTRILGEMQSKSMPKKFKGDRRKVVKSERKAREPGQEVLHVQKSARLHGAFMNLVQGGSFVPASDEKKSDGKTVARASKLRLLVEPSLIETARSLFNSNTVYRFRIFIGSTTGAAVATNVMAGVVSPNCTAAAEFSGVLSALFDEYRIVEMIARFTLTPDGVTGTADTYTVGPFVSGNDYDSAAAPTTEEIVLAHAESKHHLNMQWYLQGVAGGGGTSQNAVMCQLSQVHATARFKPPRFVVTASGTNAEWILTSDVWPGGIQYYQFVLAANSDTPYSYTREFHLDFRQRR